ncbi:heat shock 70 kDa protein 12A-like isoform X2 [Ostrea edulis]|nr:heat shock 70 kDa protein 12A-like isoform X2 [Ostrea edulis]XP_056004992.1 heat shock 70 kDa protein 12A-like isoform X2 [Ostrea edulis]XP_056004993.1 heat shock 70 kDa protein 12A-like isoform X2 [Ostrea edulis]XP_056004994.1 heat shock 70 kDa protein 12A-like isoform X2 [Ostrea edulis]
MSTAKMTPVVVAIDFGTTYSGYAFSFRSDFLNDRERHIGEINTYNWNSGNLLSEKTPTALLLDKDQKFVSFGFDAENMYGKMTEEERKDNYYFHRFKMMLYDKDGKLKLTRRTILKDMKNKEMLAIDIFTHSIRYLKDHFEKNLEKRDLKKHFMSHDESISIMWVLTVPAIWDEPAKQFMQEAAEKAGIPRASLLLCLEPEAAAIYCKWLHIEKGNNECLDAMKPGRRFIVLDAGGGTIDMAIQEVREDGKLQEIGRVQGGDWGGIYVDGEFKQLLEEIVSKPIFEGFRAKYTGDYIDLFRFFERKKREKQTSLCKSVRMQVPQSFLNIADDDISKLTKSRGLEKIVEWKRDKVHITIDKYFTFFSEVIDKIVVKVEEMLVSETAMGTNIILMVGGFSECHFLQERIKHSFPNCSVVVPPDCGLAVLKGAVMFGHDPEMIAARVVKYTYGVATNTKFIEGTHPESKKTVMNGKEYCKDKFDIHVESGKLVHYKEWTEETYNPIYEDQTSVKFRVFTCDHTYPQYIDDEGCKEIGSLTVPMPNTSGGTGRRVKARIQFGGTKITVEGIDETSKKSVDVRFDFLEGSS